MHFCNVLQCNNNANEIRMNGQTNDSLGVVLTDATVVILVTCIEFSQKVIIVKLMQC